MGDLVRQTFVGSIIDSQIHACLNVTNAIIQWLYYSGFDMACAYKYQELNPPKKCQVLANR